MSLTIVLFAAGRFPDRDRAAALLRRFSESGGILAPTRYGEHQPLRDRFEPSDLTAPANLLCGYERVPSGWVYLRGVDDSTVSWVRWSEGDPVIPWYLSVSDEALGERRALDDIMRLIETLATNYDIVFGTASTPDYWDLEYGQWGDSVGVQPLPGIFPLTIFGKDLIEHFGPSKLRGLAIDQVHEWGSSVGLVVSRDLTVDHEALRSRAWMVRGALGEEFFFDRAHPRRSFCPVPSLASEPTPPVSEDLPAKTSYLFTTIRSPDGDEYRDPRALVGTLATYLSDVEPLVWKYTEQSLAAIDAYFGAHPPSGEFAQEFLLLELIPALGAHLGEVLVRSFNGTWHVRQPLLYSGVVIGAEVVPVFALSYEVVFEGKRLAEIVRRV